ncbi:hypothetical protein ACFPYJ_30615 [Paenibacillus solisilvae]|uniref:Uncharacterized protein n=1 Tax=Paenibacillus solisilvae TaxID=2486751 RepID=A0ABW0W8K5_9BACL
MQFTIATARSYNSAAGLLEQIHFKLPLSFMNGVFERGAADLLWR